MRPPEIAVVGLGPAGRALAHRLAVRGARVLAIDPAPERIWEPTYGGWAHQVPAWLPDDVAGATSDDTRLIARESHRLAGEYIVLDNAALHRALPLPEVVTDTVDDADLADLAPVVVDCRGARRVLDTHPRPVQTAYGVRLPREVGEPLLDGADAVLMDWRPFDGSEHWGSRPPSFCYVIPLPDGRLLAEETCLAGDPAIDVAELTLRLRTRLTGRGLDITPWEDDAEEVRIPMLPPPDAAPLRFGAAGGQLNPITGYSVFASLDAADEAACRLIATGSLETPSSPRPLALRALLGLAPDDVVHLFDAFGRLPARSQRAVFDPRTPTPRLLAALARQWAHMPPTAKAALVGATASGALP